MNVANTLYMLFSRHYDTTTFVSFQLGVGKDTKRH